MTKAEIIAFIEQNPVCSLASTDGNQAHARGFLSNIIGGELYFTTSAHKSVGKELQANPKLELCYFTPDFMTMLRITAEADFSGDKRIKQYLIDNRDYLKGFSASDPDFLLFSLKGGKARFWTLADNTKEDQLELYDF